MVPRFGDARDWFFEKPYGMFIHWGLYAVNGFQEQERLRCRVPREEYAKLIHEFNPVRFDPDAWLDLAVASGMEFIVVTTKHLDGFCLWDTKETDFNIMNTPYGKDVVGMLADACHKRDLPLLLYYSVVDSRHPNYPYRGKGHEAIPGKDDEPDAEKYLAYLKAQVRELCTNYGEIHGIWWDCNEMEADDPSINAMIRELQPKAVVNDRGCSEGDFGTPERDWVTSVNEVLAFDKPTQACQAIGFESWSYKPDEDFYTDGHLIRSIDNSLAKGGGYLLNVGPDALGVIPPEARARLLRIGAWRHAVREAFEDVEPVSHLIENRDVLLTRRGNTLYVHLRRVPITDRVLLNPIDQLPKSAVLLNTGEPVETVVNVTPWKWRDERPYLRLRQLPVNEYSNTVLVVKLEFEEWPL